MPAMADIRHVVVLMLENRSFDMMLSGLYPASPKFNGLAGNETNSYSGHPYPVSGAVPESAKDAPFCVPSPDPGEKFTDITQQIYSDSFGHQKSLPITMGGFASNYAMQTGSGNYDPNAVMYHYENNGVLVLRQLANAFAVSDEWFASAPCQTWPNRFFAHCGTASGVVDNDKFFLHGQVPFQAPSVFGLLEAANQSWRVYYNDFPQSLLLGDVLDVAAAHYHPFKNFLADAAQGVLPAYSFIEPQYFGDFFGGAPPNDQHPPHNLQYGEQLIADVYNALRSSKICWPHTLLIVTYDEHGGNFDHVHPPAAVSPDGLSTEQGFKFDRYGVRVPAVIVSPWVAQGSVLRARGSGELYPFDHTSIIKTLRELYDLPQLTDRDAAAPSLLPFLNLPAALNNGPSQITGPLPQISQQELWNIGQSAPNDLQSALARFADTLQADMSTAGLAIAGEVQTVAQLATRVASQLKAFLGIG